MLCNIWINLFQCGVSDTGLYCNSRKNKLVIRIANLKRSLCLKESKKLRSQQDRSVSFDNT